MRLGRLGLREKKPSQGKKERPERPERLVHPERLERLERLEQRDEEAGRVLIALSGLGDQKMGRDCNLPFFLICQTDPKRPSASLPSTSSLGVLRKYACARRLVVIGVKREY